MIEITNPILVGQSKLKFFGKVTFGRGSDGEPASSFGSKLRNGLYESMRRRLVPHKNRRAVQACR